MADIDIKCSNCSKVTTVSEFADINLVKCKSCGGPLNKDNKIANTPASQSHISNLSTEASAPSPDSIQDITGPASAYIPEEKKKLSLRKVVEAQPASNAAADGAIDPQSQQWNQISQAKAEVANRPEKHFNHALASGILFIVLAAIFGGARFGNFMDAGMIGYIITFGPWIVIAMHIFITLKAFKDTVFNGILCVLIPGYSFYYIFFVSDDFYTRAVMGGILVGIGYDSAIVMNEWIQTGIQNVNDLIAQKKS